MNEETKQNEKEAIEDVAGTEASKTTEEKQQEPDYVDFNVFQKMDMRVGTIKFVEPVEGTDKLLRFLIDFGPDYATHDHETESGEVLKLRQIVSGIRLYYPEYQELVGKQALYILNLKPREIRGVTSHGMLMAVGNDDAVFMVPEKKVEAGSEIH